MSRIGLKAIPLPKGVDVKIDGRHVSVKGPKGALEMEVMPLINVEIEDGVDLRPGMRGHAKLESGSRPLAWLVFHRAIEQILFRIGV